MSGDEVEGRAWQRAERLDADGLVEALYAETGVRLLVEGPCAGGEVGASYVRWADGRRSVLKWRPHSRVGDLREGPVAVTEAARAVGIPAPATELIEQVGQVGHAVVMVQQLLPGAKVDRLDEDLLDQALSINARQEGLLEHRPDLPAVQLYLREDGPGFCLHEPLRQHSRRSAELERWVAQTQELGGSRNDVVHLDFHPGNLLSEHGRITGVVDWDGAGRGDRRLDLVALRFGVQGQASPKVIKRLDDVLDQVPEGVLKPLWAHLSLRLVDWSIRHHAPESVDQWLDLADRRR